MTTSRITPDGYWPSGMDASEQSRSIAEFEAAIYPIWMGIETKDKEAEALLTATQVSALPVMLEVETMHRKDIAIHQSGIKPRREATATGSELQKRAAAKSYGGWKR